MQLHKIRIFQILYSTFNEFTLFLRVRVSLGLNDVRDGDIKPHFEDSTRERERVNMTLVKILECFLVALIKLLEDFCVFNV